MKDSKIYYYKDGWNGAIKIAKNQKVIQIHRIKNSINFEANYFALNRLSSDAYVLYMYLLMRNPAQPWALSSKDVISRTSLSMRTYNNAVSELIEKKYLVEGEINLPQYSLKGVECGMWHFEENAYHLYEDPDLITKRDKENDAYDETC